MSTHNLYWPQYGWVGDQAGKYYLPNLKFYGIDRSIRPWYSQAIDLTFRTLNPQPLVLFFLEPLTEGLTLRVMRPSLPN